MTGIPSVMASVFSAVLAAALMVAPAVASAEEPPETEHLVLAGLGMAIPTYMIGVVAHEGSHALAATMSGAEVQTLRLLPGMHRGKFYFGYVSVRGLRCDRQRAAFLLAPKLTDALALGAYSLAYFTETYPENHYGQLALTVLATGFWVDFTKDVFAFWDHNDMVKVYRIAGADRELERLPFRLLHAGLAAAGAVAIVKGYQQIFDEPESSEGGTGGAAFVPLWVGAF